MNQQPAPKPAYQRILLKIPLLRRVFGRVKAAFDEGAVTAADWQTYPILTMAEMPDVKVVIAARPEFGEYGQGSESANALAAPAIAAAIATRPSVR